MGKSLIQRLRSSHANKDLMEEAADAPAESATALRIAREWVEANYQNASKGGYVGKELSADLKSIDSALASINSTTTKGSSRG